MQLCEKGSDCLGDFTGSVCDRRALDPVAHASATTTECFGHVHDQTPLAGRHVGGDQDPLCRKVIEQRRLTLDVVEVDSHERTLHRELAVTDAQSPDLSHGTAAAHPTCDRALTQPERNPDPVGELVHAAYLVCHQGLGS